MASWQEEVTTRDERLSHIFKTGDLSDVTFIVGISPEQKHFKLHKIILSMYSDVFERMFYGSLPENSEVHVTDIQPDVFEKTMKYVYEESFSAVSMEEAMLVYSTADKYNFKQLRTLCGVYITEHVCPQNIPLLYRMPNLLETLEVSKKTELLLREKTADILMSDNFVESPLDLIKHLLQMDNLNVDSEEMLFEFILKWAKERNSNQFKQEELRKIMEPFLPDIRFLAMSVEGFLSGPGSSGVLTDNEIASISANLVAPCQRELPSWCSKKKSRKMEAGFSLPYKSLQLMENHSCDRFSKFNDDSVDCIIKVKGGNIIFQGVSIYTTVSTPDIVLTVYKLDGYKDIILCTTKCFYDSTIRLSKVILLDPITLHSETSYRISLRSNSGRIFRICAVKRRYQFTRSFQKFNFECTYPKRHILFQPPYKECYKKSEPRYDRPETTVYEIPSAHFYEIFIDYE